MTTQELVKSAADIRRRILALKPLLPKDSKGLQRWIGRLDDNSLWVLQSLNIRKELKLGEPAVSGVEFTESPYQTLLVPADDIQAEGF